MPSKHAEMDAINKIKYLRNIPKIIDIFVIRFNKNNDLCESRPCIHCIKSLDKFKTPIRFVYYSTKDGIIVRERFDDMKTCQTHHISSGIRNKLKNKLMLNNCVK